ncbi:MAG: aminotransferase class I/II-fold pyridoxal phosphate-dependent enzyme [Planctomycetota bacterium]
MRGANRLEAIPLYPFVHIQQRVRELKAKGIRPIDFGVGDPRIPTPEFIRRAAAQGIEKHRLSGYPTYDGSPELRRAIAAWYERRFGVRLDPDAEICVTIGSKEAVFNVHEGFVDPGDVVFGPSPGYPPYRLGTLFAEGVYVPYAVEAASRYLPALQTLPRDHLERGKIFWVNYPHSPTGRVATRSELEVIARFCRDRDLLLFSDEAYSELYFTEEAPHSALELGKEGVLAFNSLSKRSAMTGYRVGFVAGDSRLVAIFKRVKSNVDSGTPWFVQEAAIAALQDEEHVAAMRAEYRRKGERLAQAFERLPLERCFPQGAIYLWQEAPEGWDGQRFANRLLEPDVALVVTPGSLLAEPVDGRNPGERFVRLALVPQADEIEEAVRRLERLRISC